MDYICPNSSWRFNGCWDPENPSAVSANAISDWFYLETGHEVGEFMNIINAHKDFIAWYQKKLGLSDYALLWFVFFKGVFVTLLFQKLIFR